MMCESKLIAKGGDDVDIGCGNSFGGEGGDDAGASDIETVNNVMESFGYTETTLSTPAEFKGWIKEYMNAIVLKLREKSIPKEQIQKFKAGAPGICMFFLKQFSEVQYYLGPSFCPESMCFSIWGEGALTPNFYYIMGGMDAIKF
jgi:hypothetical protein